ANAITLSNAGNNFTGAVSASNTGANAIQLMDLNAIQLGTISTANNLTVIAGDSVTQSGAVTANTLIATLTGTASQLNLGTASNNIVNIGAIIAPAGFTLTNGNNPVTVSGSINTSASNGPVSISTGTAGFSQNNVDITAGSGAITLTADTVSIAANTGSNAFQTTGVLTLKPFTAGTAMSLAGASAFDLNATEVTDLAGGVTGVGSIVIGDVAASTGAMTIGNAVNFGAKTVTLNAGSFTDGNTTGRTITAASLNLNARNAAGGIGAAGGNNAIDVAVTNLTFNTNNGGAFINTAGAVNLGPGMSSVGTGAIGLTAATGAITQSGAIIGLGTTTLAAVGANNNITLMNAANDFGTVVVTSGKDVSLVDANALNIGGIIATGLVDVRTQTGDLTVSQNVSTTNATASAITLNAGKDTAAGTSTGGNIIISGSPTISTGAGGRATLYSGSISDSTGLAALIGSGSGRFRYNSDEANANYSTVLGTGSYAIYREQPTLTITANSPTAITYGDSIPAYTTTVTGVNGDTALQALSTQATVADDGVVATSGFLTAADHTLTASGALGQLQLGYAAPSYVTGTLTIGKLGISGSITADNKVYNANDAATILTRTLIGAIGGDDITYSGGTATFSNKNVANNKTVTATGLSLSGLDAGNYTVNDTATTLANITALGISGSITADNKVYNAND
ncbi:MAG: YDG domain-containing protein, partial [Pseudomonadota bacterium]